MKCQPCISFYKLLDFRPLSGETKYVMIVYINTYATNILNVTCHYNLTIDFQP